MIRVTRGKEGLDRFRVYKIYINDVYHGKIKANETKEFVAEKGRHIVCARVGLLEKYGSNLLHVDANSSIVDIEIRNALTGWNRWLFPWSDGNFEKDEYLFLSLKKKDGA